MRREVRTIAQVEIDRQRADFEDAVHRLENNNQRLSTELSAKHEVISYLIMVFENEAGE